MFTVPLSQSVKARQIRFLSHCLRRPQKGLISKYALYHPTHGKPRPGGANISDLMCLYVLFNQYVTKIINPQNFPFLTKFVLSIGGGQQSLGAHGGQLLAPLGTPMSASAEQGEPGFSGAEEVN